MSMAKRIKRIAESLAAKPQKAPTGNRVVVSDDEVLIPLFTTSESYGTKWDKYGKAWSKVNDGPWKRDPGKDFGTPTVDLLIDPWIQDALKKGPEQP